MKWSLGVTGFFVGLACGLILTHLHAFTFSNKISSADVLNWVIVLVVASALQAHWQRNYSDVRVAKNILIDQLKEIIGILQSTRSLFADCYGKGRITDDDRRAMLGFLKNLSNSIRFLEGALKRKGSRFDKINLEKAQMLYLDYKRILTGGRFPSRPYKGEDVNEQEDAYRSLREYLHELMFQINEL